MPQRDRGLHTQTSSAYLNRLQFQSTIWIGREPQTGGLRSTVVLLQRDCVVELPPIGVTTRTYRQTHSLAMQGPPAPGAMAPGAPVLSGPASEPMGQYMYVAAAIKNNHDTLNFK